MATIAHPPPSARLLVLGVGHAPGTQHGAPCPDLAPAAQTGTNELARPAAKASTHDDAPCAHIVDRQPSRGRD